jgi:uncharacterized membrane protein
MTPRVGGQAAAPDRKPLGLRAGEDGQVGVLIIGYLLLTLLVLAVVLAASAVYLGHTRLLSVADGAALAAAHNFTIDTGSARASPPQPVLDAGAVRSSVEGYLQRTAAGQRFTSLAVDGSTGTPDGRTAQVVLTAVVRPPLVTVLVPEGIPITATADARSELTR